MSACSHSWPLSSLTTVRYLPPQPSAPEARHWRQLCWAPWPRLSRWGFAVKVHVYFVMSCSRCDTGLCPCVGSFHTDEVSVLWLGSHKAWDYPMVWGICITNDKDDMRSFFSPWMHLAYSHHRLEAGDAGLGWSWSLSCRIILSPWLLRNVLEFILDHGSASTLQHGQVVPQPVLSWESTYPVLSKDVIPPLLGCFGDHIG